MHILVIEDEAQLCSSIAEGLRLDGYEVDTCMDGNEGLDLCLTEPFDLVLLDLNLPGMDGLSILQQLRAENSSTPVIILSARTQIQDKVEGLESGGDYYLTKPFDFQELLAVVHVMTRKYTGNRSNIYTIADLTLDTAAKTVVRAGKNIELTQKEFSLLEYMVRNRGVVLSREMIENNLWNYDYEGGTNVVDVYVGYLRKKMDTGFDKKLIHTVWGTGWVLKEG